MKTAKFIQAASLAAVITLGMSHAVGACIGEPVSYLAGTSASQLTPDSMAVVDLLASQWSDPQQVNHVSVQPYAWTYAVALHIAPICASQVNEVVPSLSQAPEYLLLQDGTLTAVFCSGGS